MADSNESFLSRWARRKHEAAQGKNPDAEAALTKQALLDPKITRPPAGEDSQPGPGERHEPVAAAEPELDLEKIDFDKLDANSDYRPFMSAKVPDEVRNKALNKLWLSDPVLSAPDELSDYMEDFTDAARAVPAGMLKTAYKVGQGFLTDEEAAEWDRLGRKEPEIAKPALGEVEIARENADQPDIAALLAASGAHPDDASPLTAEDARLFIARSGGKAVGLCALTMDEDGSGKVKRMWVAPEARRQGIGRKLLAAIEASARAEGLSALRLEIGTNQPEAIALFRGFGYIECEPFGSYQPDARSRLFLEKRLA